MVTFPSTISCASVSLFFLPPTLPSPPLHPLTPCCCCRGVARNPSWLCAGVLTLRLWLWLRLWLQMTVLGRYYQGQIIVIDVSQAVEHSHPHALEFLRKDIMATNVFFQRKGVSVMTMHELFDFITDVGLLDAHVEECVNEAEAAAALTRADNCQGFDL